MLMATHRTDSPARTPAVIAACCLTPFLLGVGWNVGGTFAIEHPVKVEADTHSDLDNP